MFELMAMTFVLMFSELAIAKREMEFEHMRNEMRQKLEELDNDRDNIQRYLDYLEVELEIINNEYYFPTGKIKTKSSEKK